jgi:hypothetical protein
MRHYALLPLAAQAVSPLKNRASLIPSLSATVIAPLPILPNGLYNAVNVSHSASPILVSIPQPHSVWFQSPLASLSATSVSICHLGSYMYYVPSVLMVSVSEFPGTTGCDSVNSRSTEPVRYGTRPDGTTVAAKPRCTS